MIVTLENHKKINLSEGIDLSITLKDGATNPRAWYVAPPRFEPVRENGWVGVVKEGGAVNFRNVFFNPHGHGTHTECLGHITPTVYSINNTIKTFFMEAQVITIKPETIKVDGIIDRVITYDQLLEAVKGLSETPALIIRTLPNNLEKTVKNYSDSNPPYIDIAALAIINQLNVKHLLVDLPSVDKEKDDGILAFHHGFWNVPENPNFERTITEFIYVPENIPDGAYFMNLQVAPFENDAAPSRPLIFKYLD